MGYMMSKGNSEDKFMEEIRKFWEEGINFCCEERRVENFMLAEECIKDENYMAEFDLDNLGKVVRINFRNIAGTL